MGLNVRALANFATAISKIPETTVTAVGNENLPAFDLLL